jgi:hypothetical protein
MHAVPSVCMLLARLGSARHALRRQKQEIVLKEEGAYMYSLVQIVTVAIDGWCTTTASHPINLQLILRLAREISGSEQAGNVQTDGRRDSATPRLGCTAEQLNSILASPVIARRPWKAHILRSSTSAGFWTPLKRPRAYHGELPTLSAGQPYRPVSPLSLECG